jgi:tRNA(fMet)-specific endonuclease VapC
MPWLLDTNVWITLLKRRAPLLRRKVDALDPDMILTCSIVKAELRHGAWKYELPDLRRAQVNAAMAPYRSLPFDDAAAEHYAYIRHDLERRGEIIGPNDLKIAAICLAHGLTLVSANAGEFSRVAGLPVEDWSHL